MSNSDSTSDSQGKKSFSFRDLQRAIHKREKEFRLRDSKHAEIDRRHSRAKERKGTPAIFNMTRARLTDLRIVFQRRYGPLLPDDDSGRDDLYLVAQHLAFERGDLAEHLTQWAALYAPWFTAAEIAKMSENVGSNREWLSAHDLGERIRLTREERDALKFKTIRAFDMTASDMKAARRAKDREYQAEKRRKAGAKPRSKSAERLKPWEAAGVSRATWYRHRETNSSAPKDSNASDATVSFKFSGLSLQGLTTVLTRSRFAPPSATRPPLAANDLDLCAALRVSPKASPGERL